MSKPDDPRTASASSSADAYDLKPTEPVPVIPIQTSKVLPYARPMPPVEKEPRIAWELRTEHQFLLGIVAGAGIAFGFWQIVFKTRLFVGAGWMVGLIVLAWLAVIGVMIVSDRLRGWGLGLLASIPVSILTFLMICARRL